MAFTPCAFIRPDGTQCPAPRLKTGPYCYFHEPSLKEKRDLARRVGGINAQKRGRRKPDYHIELRDGEMILPKDIVDTLPAESRVVLDSTDALVDLMERTLTLAFAGRASPQLVNSITHAINAARQVLETAVLEKRIRELERRYGVKV
jgi:hypothetical protein